MPLGLVSGRAGVDRERMHAAGEFIRKRRIDHPVLLDPALSPKYLGHDVDPEMGFATWPAPGVAGVLM